MKSGDPESRKHVPACEGQPVIRTYRERDQSAVDDLYTLVFGRDAMQAFRARWNWQFYANPACKDSKSMMWVAELNGEVIGFLASFTCRFKILDDETILRLPCDLMVSSAARGKGVGEKLIRAYIDTEQRIANALGYSPPALRMYQRLGYREVEAEPFLMRVCRLRPILRDAIERRLRAGALRSMAANIAAALGGATQLGFGAFNRWKSVRDSTRFEIRPCTTADDEFDHLWRCLSPKFPIVAVRDRSWIQWRFFDDPLFEHGVFGAYDDHGDLVGYIDVRSSKRRGLRFGRILDLFCDPEQPELVRALLAAGARWFEAERVDLVTCLGHVTAIRREISSYCYHRPARLQRPAMFLTKEQSGLDDRVYDPDSWHLTHADGDDGFSP